MSGPVRLRLSELRVPLKMTFRHASAARTHGESVWVEASRDALRGFGEGCPRSYVTGETRQSCLQWVSRWRAEIETACVSLPALEAWAAANAAAIDASPSMWCAIELCWGTTKRGRPASSSISTASSG